MSSNFDTTITSILLDSVPVRECFQANDIEGWVDCYDIPVRVNEDGTGAVTLPRQYGHVEYIVESESR